MTGADIGQVLLLGLALWLRWRVDRLEQRLTRMDPGQSIDTPEFFRRLQEYYTDRLPTLSGARDSAEAADELASAIAADQPSLQQVIVVSMKLPLGAIKDVKMTDAAIDDFWSKVTDHGFWPIPSMTIERWSTHTTVFAGSGHRRTIYHLDHDWLHWPSVLWERPFAVSKPETADSGALEVVLWDNMIKCWARGGQFEGKYWSGESDDDYEFIAIPLDEDRLKVFLRPDDDESVEAPYRYEGRPWNRQYSNRYEGRPWNRQYSSGGGHDATWSLEILDYVAWARR